MGDYVSTRGEVRAITLCVGRVGGGGGSIVCEGQGQNYLNSEWGIGRVAVQAREGEV